MAVPDVECMGVYRNRTVGETQIEILKVSELDANYYFTTLKNYELGADYSYLPSQGISLIVSNKTTKRFADMTSGFRRVGNSKLMEATLKFYDVSPKGEDIVVGIQCQFIEP